jgi:hypothetical protein
MRLDARRGAVALFGHVDDTVLEAMQTVVGRKLSPEALTETCRAGLKAILYYMGLLQMSLWYHHFGNEFQRSGSFNDLEGVNPPLGSSIRRRDRTWCKKPIAGGGKMRT